MQTFLVLGHGIREVIDSACRVADTSPGPGSETRRRPSKWSLRLGLVLVHFHDYSTNSGGGVTSKLLVLFSILIELITTSGGTWNDVANSKYFLLAVASLCFAFSAKPPGTSMLHKIGLWEVK